MNPKKRKVKMRESYLFFMHRTIVFSCWNKCTGDNVHKKRIKILT